MAVGYSAFKTDLKIEGSTKITSNWDVEIVNVREGEKTGQAESAKVPTWTKTEASMEANLYDKGDSISYVVTIENKGTFDAKLDNINIGKGTNEEAVNISFSGYTKGQTLKKGTSMDVTVNVSYNPNYEGGETSSEVTTDFDFVQNEGGTITPTNGYLVTYDYMFNGGKSSDSENEYLPDGSSVNLDYIAEKEGYEFIGWNTNANAKEGLKEFKLTENTTLYAIFKKDLKVTYEMGENVASIGKNEDQCSLYNNDKSCEITLPTITPDTGYEVDGWYKEKDKVGTSNDKYKANESNVLTAKVKPIMHTVTYDYKTNGGASSTKTSDNIGYGEAIDLTPVATKEGWIFVGWNTDKDAKVGLDSLKMNNDDVTLYAIFKKDARVVTVNFHKNGALSLKPLGGQNSSEEVLTQSCTIPTAYNNDTQASSCVMLAPNITAANGFNVIGWNKDANGTTSELEAGAILNATKDEDYYAITSKKVTITFDKNGASSIGSNSQSCTIYNSNTSCDITSPNITAASGFTVLGWNTSSTDIDSGWDVNTVKSFNNNATYYAITKSLNPFTATFNANGASISSNSASCYRYNGNSSCKVTTPTITRSGFTITGWGTSANATTAAIKSGASAELNNNIAYYAVTSKLVTITYSKGAHVSEIGSTSGTCTIQNLATNCQVTLPSITAATGYTSVGWSLTNGATTGTSAGSKISVSDNGRYYANAIDNIKPSTPVITNSSNGNWTSGNVIITVKSTDAGSGIDHYEWYENGEWTTRELTTASGVGTITFTADRNATIQFRAIDKSGNISSVSTTPVKIDTKNPTVSVSTTSSTNSITVVANASAASGITKYEFSKDGGKTWINNGTNKVYTFDDLTAGQTYNIVVRVTSTVGKQTTSNSVQETTGSISKPTFSESGTTNKTVTITYPSGCGNGLTCTYQKDNGDIVNVTSSSVQVSFTDSGSLKATITDGTNTVSSSYNVKIVRTVTYNYSQNGGSSSSKTTASVEEGSVIDLTPTATKSGWTFVGWNTNKDATTKLSSLTMGKNNVTLYAIYRKEAKTVTITFNKNGATSQTPNGGSANTNQTLTQSCTIPAVYNNSVQASSCNITSPTINASSNTPTVVGYNTSSSATSSSWSQKTSKAVSSNATDYAITKKDAVTLTAKFNSNGASLSSTSNKTCTLAATYNGKAQATSCTVTAPTITRSGYTIAGYNTSASSTSNNSSYNTSNKLLTLTTSNNNSTWYAITSKVITITFNQNGAESIGATSRNCTMYNTNTSCSVTSPSIAASSNTPTVIGWSTAAGTHSNQWSVNTSKSVSSNATYYAQTRKDAKTVTITFNKNGAASQTPNGGSANTNQTLTQSCTIGATYNGTAQGTTCNITSPTINASSNTPTVVGYNTSSSATSSSWSQKTSKAVSSNATYYAITKKDAVTLTAKFNGNGASLSSTSNKTCTLAASYNGKAQATSCTVTAPTITRSGFTITGYNTSASATSNNSSYNTSNKLLTLTTSNNNSTWYAITSKKVTVTFNKGSHVTSVGSSSGSCTIQNSATNCQVTLPSITAATGYTSVGWSTTNGASSGTAAGSKITLSNNATYYGNAQDKTAPVLSNITNSSNGKWATSITLKWSITENGSGISKVQYSSNNSTWSDFSSDEWYGLTRSNNRNDTLYIRAIDNAGNISNVKSTTMKIDNSNPSLSLSTTSTSKSIRVVANASATSGISKYEYRINSGSWTSSSSNNYTFNNLNQNTSYTIEVRITSGSGKQTTKSMTAKTLTINKPTFSESATSDGKTVKITYPSGCGSQYTCTYQKDNGSSVNVTSTTVNVSFTKNGSLVAKVTDGKNTVSSSYSVTVPIDITKDTVTSGDGLYEDEYEDGRYVYKGANPNNYVKFNNELWRIVAKEADGTYKIVRNEILEARAYDKVYTDTGLETGDSNWARPATLNIYLNGTYYNGLTSTAQSQIVSHNWGNGGIQRSNYNLAVQITDENSRVWNGKVALLTVSEYLRANTNARCNTFGGNDDNYQTCHKTNWLVIEDYRWHTLSALDDPNTFYDIYSISSDGSIGGGRYVYKNYGVRPSVYLKSSIKITGGTGTESDPYTLS